MCLSMLNPRLSLYMSRPALMYSMETVAVTKG